MREVRQQLIRGFFDAIAAGNLPDEIVTPDMSFWSVTSGTSDRARFHGGVKMLAAIFKGTLAYVIDSLTCEDDRVAAEVRSHGKLPDGEPFDNNHVFLFRIRDDRIAQVAEYMNQFVVREKIVPLMQAAMARPSA